jgi:CspA family cold shock protein
MFGKVKWFNGKKGYGFITTEDGVDAFMHHSGIKEPLGKIVEGKDVKFDTQQGEKGLKAINVECCECDESNENEGVFFISAASGLRYEDHKAAGGIAAVIVDGVRFVRSPS